MTSEQEGGRRAKRRCARNRFTSSSMPSAIHYVGYVSGAEGPSWAGAAPPPPPPLQAGCPHACCPCSAAPTGPLLPPLLQVEDDETPEMIMAKFAELERIQAAAAAAKAAPPAAGSDAAARQAQGEQAQQQQQQQQPGQGAAGTQQQAPAAAPAAAAPDGGGGGEEGGLSEAQLLEVFKQTSMFNVRTALQDNSMLLGIDKILEAAGER